MMMDDDDDDDDEVEDGRGDEMQVNSCAMCILCDKNEEDNEDGVEQDSFNSRDKTAAKNHAESHLSSR